MVNIFKGLISQPWGHHPHTVCRFDPDTGQTISKSPHKLARPMYIFGKSNQSNQSNQIFKVINDIFIYL